MVPGNPKEGFVARTGLFDAESLRRADPET
jgi:hypothetical protein